jgi:ankyrin repeat protein
MRGEVTRMAMVKNLLCMILVLITLGGCREDSEKARLDARKELVKMNIEYSEDSFTKSVEKGELETVRLFLETGMSPDTKSYGGFTPFLQAAKNGDCKMMELLRSKGAATGGSDWSTCTALHFAARKGNIDAVEFVITKCGGKVLARDRNGATPLHMAGSKEVAELLVNNYQIPVSITDNNGITPLLHAVYTCQNELARFLIEKGADVNEKNQEGETPLLIAAHFDNTPLVRYLLSKGADAQVTLKDGTTALHRAWRPEVAEMLLAKGVKINARDRQGNTALRIAVVNGAKDLATYLKAHGGKMR